MSIQSFSTRVIGGEGSPFRAPRRRPEGFFARLKASLLKLWAPAQNILSKFWRWIRKPRTRAEWRKLFLKTGAWVLGILVALSLLLWFTLPNINDPSALFASQSTVILDRNGTELYRVFSEQDRTYVPRDKINDYVEKATIAIEDERFLSRSSCFDVIGFTRAVMSQLLPSLFVRSGGSTLTQQFAGNALVGRHYSLIRKAREAMLACKLERRYDKEQLVELYLNWIPYGSNAYGIEQASKNYFSKTANDLTLAESAVLASLPQRPSYFSPYGKHTHTDVDDNIKQAIARGTITSASQIPRNAVTIGLIGQSIGSGSTTVYVGGRSDQVLKNMLDQSLINEEEYTKALTELKSMTFAKERDDIRAPHFVLAVEKQVQQLLGIPPDDAEAGQQLLEQGGFHITTTLDWNIQQVADKIISKRKEDILKLYGAHNTALVALAPGTREVLAYVGNSDFNDEEHEGKIDMVQSPRQPGSSFKAFTYALAFQQGFGPGSVVFDVPTEFGTDKPQNFDGTFWGITTMRKALGGSRNIPAIKAFFLGGGEEPLLSLAARMGVTTPISKKMEQRKTQPNFDYGWPLSIGAAETPLLEMAQGYATLADGGMMTPVTTILKITDKDGNIRYEAPKPNPQQVLDPRVAALVTSALSDVSARPNEYWQQILSVPGYEAAAKTGTSNKCLERNKEEDCTLRRPESLWTVGYTPNLIAGVWVGNATSQSLYEKADGLTAAAPIWHDFMVGAQKVMKETKASFTVPPNITQPLLSKLSGELASQCTPVNLRLADLTLKERTPTKEDPACILLKVDKVTGQLASPACPEEAQEEQAFYVPASEAPLRWPLWEQGVQEWAKEQMLKYMASDTHTGSQLPLPLPPTETCDPAKTPGRFDKPTIRIEYPSNGERVSYPAFIPNLNVFSASEVKSVELFIDDKPLRVFDSAPFVGSVRAPRTIEQSGTHTLRAVVTDQYFNTATDEVTFSFE